MRSRNQTVPLDLLIGKLLSSVLADINEPLLDRNSKNSQCVPHMSSILRFAALFAEHCSPTRHAVSFTSIHKSLTFQQKPRTCTVAAFFKLKPSYLCFDNYALKLQLILFFYLPTGRSGIRPQAPLIYMQICLCSDTYLHAAADDGMWWRLNCKSVLYSGCGCSSSLGNYSRNTRPKSRVLNCSDELIILNEAD